MTTERAVRSKSRRRRLGQYFTSADIAGFVCAMLRRLGVSSPAPRVIDPACGEGVFLRKTLEAGIAERENLIGCDIDPALADVWAATGMANVHNADGLADHPELGIETNAFDIVIGNPPFGFDGRGRPRKEIAFLHRFVRLTRTGGRIAVILPEGFFTNARTQDLRDELLDQLRVQAIIELPQRAFSREQTAARTAILFAERGDASPEDAVLLGRIADDWSGDAVQAVGESVEIAASQLRGERWDPRWWLWPDRERLDHCQWPVVPLGRFIRHITYGPIITGRKPEHVDGGVVIINQKQLGRTGLVLDEAVRVAEGSDFDLPRARVQRGDLLLARCGAGSLPQAKLAIVEDDFIGTVSCFVDIIRLEGIEPRYAAAFLKSRYGLGQIGRLLNGVGTPNISFGEIRKLRIPMAPEAVQARVAGIWRRMARADGEASREKLLQEAIDAVEKGIDSTCSERTH